MPNRSKSGWVLAVLLITACAPEETPAPDPAAGDTPAVTESTPAPTSEPAAIPDVHHPAVAEIDAFIDSAGIKTQLLGWRQHLPQPPTASFTGSGKLFWHLETSHGGITFELLPDVAPAHVSSTIYLTRLGFYDTLKFHRIIPGFMAQGGDPLGVGRGGPGYNYAGEFDPAVGHDRPGVLSMANAGPGTDGSQFFITFGPTPHLNGKHTVFGNMVDGRSTLEALEAIGTRSGRTKQEAFIKRAWVAGR